MSTPDPFEDFLEEALGGPDFELGHDMRRRLLEAAAAGDRVLPDNVVPMNRADPDESAGFAWLVGESPATPALMGRMIDDKTFMDALDGERCFLRTLRAALRRGAAAAATAPAASPSRRRGIAAAALSAAAAITLAAGSLFFNGAAQKPATAVAVAPVSEVSAIPADLAERSSTGQEAISVDSSGDSGSGIAVNGGGGLAEEDSLAKMKLPDLPEHGSGTGRSIDPGDPLLAEPQLPHALAIAAKEAGLPEPMLAALGGGMEGRGAAFGEQEGLLASLEGGLSSSSSSLGSIGGFGGMQAASSGLAAFSGPGKGGRDSSTIPEPGGAMPVMLGLLVLLLKRPRRTKPAPAAT